MIIKNFVKRERMTETAWGGEILKKLAAQHKTVQLKYKYPGCK